MAKGCALYFASAGYLVVVCYHAFAFAPVRGEPARNLVTPSCINWLIDAGLAAPRLGAMVLPLVSLTPIVLGELVTPQACPVSRWTE